MTSNGIPTVTWPGLGKERNALWPGIEKRLGYCFRDPTLRDEAMMSAAWANEAVAKGWGAYASNKQLARVARPAPPAHQWRAGHRLEGGCLADPDRDGGRHWKTARSFEQGIDGSQARGRAGRP
jgi:hypothetical protein